MRYYFKRIKAEKQLLLTWLFLNYTKKTDDYYQQKDTIFMDFNLKCFATYEADFQTFAETVTPWESTQKPVLSTMPLFLCLYGENGLSPEEEFQALETIKAIFQQAPEKVRKLEIEAPNHYWQETILFVTP
jgi:hypothetical protein